MGSHWRAKAETQASKLVHALQKAGAINSVGTFRNYQQAFKNIAQSFKDADLPSINNVTPKQANEYLESRAFEVSQSQLNQERQALQSVMQNYNHKLSKKETLPVCKSVKKTVLESRAYTPEQVQVIADQQQPKNAIATEIAYACGLRAHELYTLRPIDEQRADPRPAHSAKFTGRAGARYSVRGKGGLVREISVPTALAERLEGYRLVEPRKVADRGVYYLQHYAIGGGNSYSASFTRVSQNNFGWSNGAHGMRHTYAQERMIELQKVHSYRDALTITSQEMGHFRPEITEVYMR